MFPLSHVYVSTKVMGRKSHLLVFGSILPDVSWSSRSAIGRDQIHYAPKKFYEFVIENFPDLKDLGIGVRLHSQIDKGADYYSDDEMVGFAKIEGKKIQEEVAKLLDIQDPVASLVVAHNFIEAGVDLNVRENFLDVWELYKRVMAEVDLKSISQCLAKYLDLKENIVLDELNEFCQFVSPQHLSTLESMVQGMVVPMGKVRWNKEVDAKAAEEILKKAKQIVENRFREFLDGAADQMKVDFKGLDIY